MSERHSLKVWSLRQSRGDSIDADRLAALLLFEIAHFPEPDQYSTHHVFLSWWLEIWRRKLWYLVNF